MSDPARQRNYDSSSDDSDEGAMFDPSAVKLRRARSNSQRPGSDSARDQRSHQRRAQFSRRYLLYIALAVIIIIVAGQTAHASRARRSARAEGGPVELRMIKPAGVHIVGIVFYGRARFVDILDCYLRQNLVSSGGYLDEVRFMEYTDDEDDLAYLRELVPQVPEYTVARFDRSGGYDSLWESLTADDTIYVKIDDDIVFVGEDAIPRMVQSLIAHPEAYDISANVVNSAATWNHWHNGAVYPFMPEPKPPKPAVELTDWRMSKVARFQGAVPEEWDFASQLAKSHPRENFEIGAPGGPPWKNHRWRPLTNTSASLFKTPIAQAADGSLAWASWAMASQQHYSLLQNLEHGTLDKYYYGNDDEGLWNQWYQRYNLNFLAIWGSTVRLALPGVDDEQDLTVTFPLRYKRPLLMNTRAIVAHFNFGVQHEVGDSDLLDRFRLYANEMVCTADNQKSALPERVPASAPA